MEVTITKDLFTFISFSINIILLAITAYAVWKAPLKAVEIGRKLSDEQKRSDERMNLFLRLFRLRGTPLNYEFVRGLNEIEIVFQNSSAVISNWRNLRLELQKEGSEKQHDIVMECIFSLLSQMAQDLGYGGLDMAVRRNHYYPKGFQNWNIENDKLREAQTDFYKTSMDYNKKMIDMFEENLILQKKLYISTSEPRKGDKDS